jgi:hypothetical protein
MIDFTPKSNKAEWHLTYRCDLACTNCNRACFLPPQTPDMTLDDAREFRRQVESLDPKFNYHPRIIIIGGEPTLHRDFLEFVALANAMSPGRVEVWSNGFRPRADELLEEVRKSGLARVVDGTIKPDGSVLHPVNDIFLAPCDIGETREPCGSHACITDPDCGISVDAAGYSLCCMGGAIDGVLRLRARTKRLADLFDPEFAERQTRTLCNVCGQHRGVNGHAATARLIAGTLMSPTWLQAVNRIRRIRNAPVQGVGIIHVKTKKS